MLLLAPCEREPEHFFLGLAPLLEAEKKMLVGCGAEFKNPRCEAATICGGRPGRFSLADNAGAASQPLSEIR
jgi:hypothetical protein